MNVTKKSIRLRLLGILLMLCMAVSLLPTTAFASTVADPDTPDDESSIVVHISKRVHKSGSVAPKVQLFELEITPVNQDVDISELEISGERIATYGISNDEEYRHFSSELKIGGNLDVITTAGGLKIKEKDDGAADWTYDTVEYTLTYNQDASFGESKFNLKQNDADYDSDTMDFTNTYNNDTPHTTPDVTIEVPISKTVVNGGTAEPDGMTFEFEVEPVNEGVDISGLIITDTTIRTWGADTYGSTLTIYGDLGVINTAGGLKITEKNDGATYWTYDKTAYTVTSNDAGGWTYKQYGDSTLTGPGTLVTGASFTNTYTNTPSEMMIEVPISKTVVKGGTAVPQEKTFKFEVAPLTQGVDISRFEITENTVDTNGAGTYEGKLKVAGAPEIFLAAGGLKITERNDGAANWTYDTEKYTLTYSDDRPILKNSVGVEVREASFTNTYTRSNPGGGGDNNDQYYTLTFESNGGSHINSITRIEGSTVSLNSYVPTMAENTFEGWYSEAALTNKVTSVILDQNKTVYAKWTSEASPDTNEPTNPSTDVERQVDDVPKTGDTSNMSLWIVLAFFSMLGVVSTIFCKKRLSAKRGR